jgi:hypothetical protein
MIAHAIIQFTDGTSKVLDLGEKCIELDLPSHMRQSIAVNQTAGGGFKLSFTTGLMEGRKWESITIRKEQTTQPE